MGTDSNQIGIGPKPKGYLFYGWVMIVVLFLINILTSSFGQYGGSLVNAMMSKELGWTATSLGLGMTCFSLFQGFVAPLMAKIMNTKGIKWSMVIGAFGFAVVCILMATVIRSVIGFIIVFGCFGGAFWAMCGTVPIQASVNNWFLKRRASAMALVMLAGGVGGFICVRMIRGAMDSAGGFVGGYYLLIGTFVLGGILALLFVKQKPSDVNDIPDGKYSSVQTKDRKARLYQVQGKVSFNRIVRHPSMWLITFASCCFFFGYSMYNTHCVLHMMNLGLSTGQAAAAFAMMPLLGIIGRAVMLVFGDFIETKFLWALAILAYGIGFYTLTIADTYTLAVVSAACIGIGWGMNMVCFGTLIGNYYGAENYPNVMGIAFPIKQVFNAISPTLAGIIMDMSGSYNNAFYFAVAICLISFALLIWMKPIKPDEEAAVA